LTVIPFLALWTALFAITFCIARVGTAFAVIAVVTFFIAPIAFFATVTILDTPFTARWTVFFLAALEIGEHAEIMVRELVKIFGLHPITVQVGILRQLFIFFEHLRRVAACPIVDAVIIVIAVAVIVLRATVVITPAATAGGLAIIHKDFSVLIKCNPLSDCCALNAPARCGSRPSLNALGQLGKKGLSKAALLQSCIVPNLSLA
jgi:hypothetical protein